MVFVTWALLVYPICTPLALVLRGVHIRQTTRAHVTNTKCNTFALKIKGIQRVAYLMSPCFKGNIFDVALVVALLPYEGFVEGSIFIIKVGGFDCGFYLSQQLK